MVTDKQVRRLMQMIELDQTIERIAKEGSVIIIDTSRLDEMNKVVDLILGYLQLR